MPDERYDKRGRTARAEWLRGRIIHHRLDERGWSRESAGLFAATAGDSLIETEPPAPRMPSLDALVDSAASLPLQRIVTASGASLHRIELSGVTRQWSREDDLTHVEVSLPELRTSLSLEFSGGPDHAAPEIHSLAVALTRPRIFFDVDRIALEPRVTAAIVATCVRSGALDGIVQIASPDRDGDGLEIHAGNPAHDGAPPNRIRPSYRHPARRAWMYCALDLPPGDDDRGLPSAMAVLAQRHDARGARMTFLIGVERGWNVVEMSGTWADWMRSLSDTATETSLFPFAPAPQFGTRCVMSTAMLAPAFI